MYKVGICGHFGNNQNLLNGQTIKTKILVEELEKHLGQDSIKTIDSYGWKGNPLLLLYRCYLLIKNCENVIIMPASNGIKVFIPLFSKMNRIFRRKLHYVVVGGWLSKLLSNNLKLINGLKDFEGIYVETRSMVSDLNKLDLNNMKYLPNFKQLSILDKSELVYSHAEPYKLCTFSRVTKEKGIEDAINAVKSVNSSLGKVVFTLDIYGQIDENYKDLFEKIMKESPCYISYKGIVNYSDSVDVLKDYFVLLFPTHYKTEGIPGTILDAYAAGVPVISSKWDSFDDIIEEGKTGFGYKLGNISELINILNNIVDKPVIISEMRINCLERAKKYKPEIVINNLLKSLY